MKTLYLHIGTPKTATTSIQQFLAVNRPMLEARGYCFPKSVTKYTNVNINKNARFLVGKVDSDASGKRRTLQKHAFDKGLNRLHRCFGTYDNVILSDEALWRVSGPGRSELFVRLQQDAEAHSYQFKIIVYLRRQDQFVLSLWNQNIKSFFRKTNTFEDCVNNYLQNTPEVFQYAEKLDNIAAIIGKENLIVRRFEPSYWVDGSIIHDFMSCIGLPFTPDFTIPEDDSNVGLKGNNVELKRIINQTGALSDKEVLYLGAILKDAQDLEDSYSCSMWTKQETMDFLAPYLEGNQRVADEYIGDGRPLFSDEIRDLPKWTQDNPYMYRDIIRCFSTVTIVLHRENEQLRADMKQLQADMKRVLTETSATQKRLDQLLNKLHHPFNAIWGRIFKRK